LKRTWPVVRREYLERVRSKGFIIGTILGPLVMAALTILPGWLMFSQRGKPVRLAVLDGSGVLGSTIEEALLKANKDQGVRFDLRPAPAVPYAEAHRRLEAEVREGKLDAFVELPPDIIESSKADYVGRTVSNFLDIKQLEDTLTRVLVDRRLAGQGLDPSRVRALTRAVELKQTKLTEQGAREDKGATIIFAIVLLMILYVSMLMWGQMLMMGVIEEKNSRVVEMVVSSVAPARLLAGKVLGIGAAGLTQFLIWVLSGAALLAYGAPMMRASQKMLPEVTPLIGVSFVVFFLLGYFLYSLLYAAVGAAVNSVQEAQSLIQPVVLPQVMALMFLYVVIQSPSSGLSVALSLIPFTAPTLMFLRIVVLTPPWWQIALSILLCLATIAGLTWVVARIYRVGILMYGKKPTLPEILRWVRTA
jgi:ABC-2 type transport system permease protein